MTRLHKQKTAIVSLSVLLVVTVTGGATAKPLVSALKVNALTQILGAAAFPLPTNVPVGTTIRIGGSSSMETINQVLKRRFEQQFVGTEVTLNTQGTGPAIKDLLDSNADLAAIGRSLTEQEKAQGLVPVPVSRHKIAIIVGSQNPFKGDLTFEQFAKIFRGEIKDWAQVGGEPGAIRFIDRPDNSDTRQAFRNYPVFKQAPFVAGKTAKQLAQDSTSQMVQALRTDGIGYAIADQLEGRGDVRVLSMHKTLPSNPKYPFSQPLIYVYKGPQPNPSAQAFLGFAAAPASRRTIETARKEASAVIDPNPLSASPRPTVSVSNPQAASSTPTGSPTATPPVASPDNTATTNAFPWWWLLAIPLLGGLWWLFKREAPLEPEDASEPTEALAPIDPIAPDVSEVVPDVAPPLLETARSVGSSRLTLVPQSCTDAYAYWEIPDDAKAALQQQGAQKLVLRLYDVTGIDIQQQPPESLQEFDCDAQAQERHLPIRTDDRDYLAELGYVADDGRWLQVARSESVRVPACPPPSIAPETAGMDDQLRVQADDAVKIGGAALADDAVAADAVVDGMTPAENTVARTMLAGDRSHLSPAADASCITLVLRRHTAAAYAYWTVPDEAKALLRQQGGQKLALRLYDVTDATKPDQQALPFQQFDANELACAQPLPLAAHPIADDHDYVVELGYVTADDRWLKLARSAPVRVLPQAPAAATDGTGIAAASQETTMQTVAPTVANSPGATTTPSEGAEHDRASAELLTSQSQVFLVPRNDQSAYVYWHVTQADKDALKQQGGQQLVLRVYDVAGTEIPSVYSVQQFLCHEWDRDQQVPIPVSNLDYVAELGYTTLDGQFLRLARSPDTHVPGA